MILNDVVHHEGSKLKKLNASLRENFKMSINWKTMTPIKATQIIARAQQKLEETDNSIQRVHLNMIKETLETWKRAKLVEDLDDDSVEVAKVILAAKEISDKLQSMIEDSAKMQVQDLLPIIDAMKTEIGPEQADTFSSSADSALGELINTLKGTKDSFDNAIAAAQGQGPDMAGMGPDGMGGDLEGDMPPDGMGLDGMDGDLEGDMPPDDLGDPAAGDLADPEADISDIPVDDGFGGDDATIGDTPSGRELKDE